MLSLSLVPLSPLSRRFFNPLPPFLLSSSLARVVRVASVGDVEEKKNPDAAVAFTGD